MYDLISRQAATQTVLEFIVEYLGGAFDEDFQKELVKRMNALPSAQRWIPCSERMPEEADGKVIICMPDQWPYNGKEQFPNAKHDNRVETAHYSQHSDRWYFEGGAISGDRPVAWMPLPEPYKEEPDDPEG